MKLDLAGIIIALGLIAAPAMAYEVMVAGRGPGMMQFDEMKPKIVSNTVKKMEEHGVASDDIKNITISANMSRRQFSGAQVWVKTNKGETYLLNVGIAGRVSGIEKRN